MSDVQGMLLRRWEVGILGTAAREKYVKRVSAILLFGSVFHPTFIFVSRSSLCQ